MANFDQSKYTMIDYGHDQPMELAKKDLFPTPERAILLTTATDRYILQPTNETSIEETEASESVVSKPPETDGDDLPDLDTLTNPQANDLAQTINSLFDRTGISEVQRIDSAQLQSPERIERVANQLLNGEYSTIAQITNLVIQHATDTGLLHRHVNLGIPLAPNQKVHVSPTYESGRPLGQQWLRGKLVSAYLILP